VIHGYLNQSTEAVYMQVMVGKNQPELMGYSDQKLFERRDEHLKTTA
jgi:hypothetical protein